MRDKLCGRNFRDDTTRRWVDDALRWNRAGYQWFDRFRRVAVGPRMVTVRNAFVHGFLEHHGMTVRAIAVVLRRVMQGCLVIGLVGLGVLDHMYVHGWDLVFKLG